MKTIGKLALGLIGSLILVCAVSAQTSIGGGGGSGSAAGVTAASPISATIYLSNSCLTSSVAPPCIYTPANTQQYQDCSWTNASTTVTCGVYSGTVTVTQSNAQVSWASGTQFTPSLIGQTITINSINYSVTGVSNVTTLFVSPTISSTSGTYSYSATVNHFTAANTGMQVMGYNSCAAFQSSTNGGQITAAGTVTATFGTATTITLSATPANSSTGNACLVIGSPDDTAASLIDTALLTYTPCPKIELPASYYWFNNPHFYTNPPGCDNSPTLYGAWTGQGNIFYSGGLSVTGRGRSNTTIWLGPGFPTVDTCAHGVQAIGCFVVPVEGEWEDFSIQGGNNGTATNMTTGHAIVEVDGPAMLEKINCINFANQFGTGGTSHIYGIYLSYWAQLRYVDNSGCGTDAFGTLSNAAVTLFQVRGENSPNNELHIANGTTVNCQYCGFYQAEFNYGSTLNYGIQNNGGKLYLNNSAVQATVSGFGFTGYEADTTASTLYSEDTQFLVSGQSTSNSAIFNNVASTTYIRNTTLSAGSSGFSYVDVTGSTAWDQGGNTGWNTAGSVSPNAGSSFVPYNSVAAACTGAVMANTTIYPFQPGPANSTTACTNTTAPVGQIMDHAGTMFLLRVIGVVSGTSSGDVITVLLNHAGGGLSATTLTCTVTATTGCKDGTHSVTFAAGDFVAIKDVTASGSTITGLNIAVDLN